MDNKNSLKMQNKFKYYELVFAINGDKSHTSSMCVLGYRKPSIEEAKEFWKKDCELYGDESLIEIYELTSEEAHAAFDMTNEANFPIFGEIYKTANKMSGPYVPPLDIVGGKNG